MQSTRLHVSRIAFRPGLPGDAPSVAALATQVFLDTYATDGVRPDLADEAFAEYSSRRFEERLRQAERSFLLAEHRAALVGFAEVLLTQSPAPAGGCRGLELVRLYVQPRAQRAGIGGRLLDLVERMAAERAAGGLWLTVWEGNRRAQAFYRKLGYMDVGSSSDAFRGNVYGNRVCFKALAAAPGTA